LADVTPERLVVHSGGRYRLDRDVVNVDYWYFKSASCLSVVKMYRGELGEGITSLWIVSPREAQRRRMLEAADRLERDGSDGILLMVADSLERMLSADPYDAEIRQLLGRIHARRGLRRCGWS
jgi:hypothetical protein